MRVGDSVGLIFSMNDRKLYNIDLGDILDLTDVVVIKPKKTKENKNEDNKM